jgi:hypothetical protein
MLTEHGDYLTAITSGISTTLTDIMAELQATAPLRETFIRPYYLSLLGANFIRACADDSSFSLRVADAARAISDPEIESLLQIREWRGRLTVGWYIGLTRRSRFVDRIAELLLASEMVYAGMGYCVALGLIGGETCASQLRAYLERYLPLRGRFYDQGWAIGALTYIEGAPPNEFLDPELWAEGNQSLDPIGAIELFKEIIELIDKKKMMLA